MAVVRFVFVKVDRERHEAVPRQIEYAARLGWAHDNGHDVTGFGKTRKAAILDAVKRYRNRRILLEEKSRAQSNAAKRYNAVYEGKKQ